MEITPETLSKAIKSEFMIGQTLLKHKKTRGVTWENAPNEGPTAPPSERDSARKDLLSQRGQNSTSDRAASIHFQHKNSYESSPSVSHSDTRQNFNLDLLEKLNSEDVRGILEGIEEEKLEKGSKYKSSEFDLNF